MELPLSGGRATGLAVTLALLAIWGLFLFLSLSWATLLKAALTGLAGATTVVAAVLEGAPIVPKWAPRTLRALIVCGRIMLDYSVSLYGECGEGWEGEGPRCR